MHCKFVQVTIDETDAFSAHWQFRGILVQAAAVSSLFGAILADSVVGQPSNNGTINYTFKLKLVMCPRACPHELPWQNVSTPFYDASTS